ncbi:hypothetical protein EJB05_29296, partial [Eragrostis curvula]
MLPADVARRLDVRASPITRLPAPVPSSPSSTFMQVGSWIPPPSGSMKINVDAALSKNSTMAAMVAVAWDDTGKFQGASALVMEGITDAKTAEALACQEGLNLASDLLAQRVRIATDCTNVVRNLQGKGMGPYGPIVREFNARRSSFALLMSPMKTEDRTAMRTGWGEALFTVLLADMFGSFIRPRAYVN